MQTAIKYDEAVTILQDYGLEKLKVFQILNYVEVQEYNPRRKYGPYFRRRYPCVLINSIDSKKP